MLPQAFNRAGKPKTKITRSIRFDNCSEVFNESPPGFYYRASTESKLTKVFMQQNCHITPLYPALYSLRPIILRRQYFRLLQFFSNFLIWSSVLKSKMGQSAHRHSDDLECFYSDFSFYSYATLCVTWATIITVPHGVSVTAGQCRRTTTFGVFTG